MNVLLSIKPEFVRMIFSGDKRYEYRRVSFAENHVRRVFVYASAPVKKIVGEIEVDEVLSDTPHAVWRLTSEGGGVSERFFFQYFSGRNTAHAIRIKSTEQYDAPLDPYEAVDGFRPPQSFQYLRDGELLDKLTRRASGRLRVG